MKKWTFRNWGAKDVGGGRWLVQLLDDNQQVRPHATERFSTRRAAMARGVALNEVGHNVQVVCEHAFCENLGEQP